MSTKYIASNWRLPNEENSGKSDNYGLSFGGGEFIDCGDSDLLSFGDSITDSPFSISAWINMDNASNFRIVSKYDAPNYEYQFDVGSSNKLQFYIFDGSNYRGVGYDTALNTGEWYHVVATYDGSGSSSGMTLYLNGLPVNDTTFSNGSYTAMHNTSATVKIGKIASSYADGKISEVAIFDYALSEPQISTLYGSSSLGAGNPMALKPAPVAFYPLGDNSASNPLTQPNESVEDASVFDFVPNDYINLNSDILFNTNQGFTFSSWVNLDSYSDPYPYLANLKTNVTDGIGIFISNNSSYAGVNVGSTDSSITKGRTTGDISSTFLNSWNNIVVTYNGNGANTLSNFSIYVNGLPVALTTTGNYSTMPNTANNIGRRSNSYHYLDGKLSNVAIWNSDQSSEISNIYNSGVPATSYTNTPTAWYKLDQSANWEADSSGNWQIPDAVSAYPQSFDFSGGNYIDCGNDSSLSPSNFTLSVWAKSDLSNGSWISKYASENYGFGIYGGSIFLNIKTSAGWGGLSLTASSYLTANNWHHIVGTYDETDLKIYVDGNLAGTLAKAGPITYSSRNTRIGNLEGTSALNFDGQISNVQIFNTALPATGTDSVETLYNNGVPLTTAIATDNLKAWYKLNDNEKFDGTNWSVENQAYPANWESALNFDGSNQYIDCGSFSALNSATAVTVSLWFKSSTYTSYGRAISNKHIEIYQNSSLYTNTQGRFYYRIRGNFGIPIIDLGGTSASGVGNLVDGNWHHLCVTFDNSTTTAVVYEDGVPVITNTSVSGTLNSASSNLYIGSSSTSGDFIDGLLSNAQIWNTALSSSDVLSIYNNGQPSTTAFASPVSWWKLDNTTTGIQDSAGSNDGTNNGATKVNTFVSTEAATSSGMTEQNLVNNNVSALNGESSGMTSANLVLSDLTRAVPYDSYSFNFDATSGDYIDCGTIPSFDDGDISFALWCNLTSNGTFQYILSSTNSSAVSGINIAVRSSGLVLFERAQDIANTQNNTGYAISGFTYGNWHHLCGTYNATSGELKAYVDGVLKSTTNDSADARSASTALKIGGLSNSSSLPANGRISNVSIFNQELTSTEVLKLYANGVPQDLANFNPQPVAFYPLGSNSFWNGSQWTVRDMIGSNDGTGVNLGQDALVGDSPRSTAGGTGTNIDIESNIALSTKWSSNNSISINMSSEARIEDTP